MTKMSQSESTLLQIAHMFVKQYYCQLGKDPSAVHRFYQEDSSFSHGGDDLGSTETIRGQKAIHEKIMKIGFSEMHARIKQVDSQATLNNGILVQVTGEISTQGNPMRNFVQTFVLCPKQSKQYYLINDIFRYQEPVEYDYTSESENNEGQSDRGEGSVTQGNTEDTTATFPTPPPPHVDPVQDIVEPDGEQPKAVEKIGDSWENFNGETESTHQDIPVPEPETFVQYSSPREPTPELISPQPKEQATDPMPSQHTWARLVSKTGPAPVVTQPPQKPASIPQREVKQPPKKPMEPLVHSAPTTSILAPSKDRFPKKGPLQLQTPDTQQVFIGGLPTDVTEDDVRATFGEMGNIIEVRLNPKNFGFIVFDCSEPVKKILERRNTRPFYIRNKTINIEPKKSSQKPGGFGGRREPGGPRSGGGPMGPRRPFKPAL
jgi:Ras GTPase-activating protein-binding protein 1